MRRPFPAWLPGDASLPFLRHVLRCFESRREVDPIHRLSGVFKSLPWLYRDFAQMSVQQRQVGSR
jgi:hypothetical protein